MVWQRFGTGETDIAGQVETLRRDGYTGSLTVDGRPWALREAAARRAPSVESAGRGGGRESVEGAVGVFILTGATLSPHDHRRGTGSGLLLRLGGPDRGQQGGVAA